MGVPRSVPMDEFVQAVILGETPKKVSANIFAGTVRKLPPNYSGPTYTLPTLPAIFSYGHHFPMLVVTEDAVWYNTDRYSQTTAGHQAAVRYALARLGYVPTNVTETGSFSQTRGYTFRAWRKARDVPGYLPCLSCGVHYSTYGGLVEHLKEDHPRKGKAQLAALTAVPVL